MYVSYQCCQKSFENFYLQQSGKGLNYYQGSLYQKGYGLGGLFGTFFRGAVSLIKWGVKTVGKQMWHSGLDILNDVSHGQEVKTAARRRLKQAWKHLTDKAAT